MRYWAYFAAKIAVSATVMYAFFRLLEHFFPGDHHVHVVPPGIMMFMVLMGLWFLAFCGLLFLCIWDQRRRCRVCLRRLRMPVETGSWGGMLLLGRPRIEYICPYGHGTLKLDELQISGLENPEWDPNGEIWDELCASTHEADDRP